MVRFCGEICIIPADGYQDNDQAARCNNMARRYRRSERQDDPQHPRDPESSPEMEPSEDSLEDAGESAPAGDSESTTAPLYVDVETDSGRIEKEELVVVYKVRADEVSEIMHLLSEAGLAPFIVNSSNPWSGPDRRSAHSHPLPCRRARHRKPRPCCSRWSKSKRQTWPLNHKEQPPQGVFPSFPSSSPASSSPSRQTGQPAGSALSSSSGSPPSSSSPPSANTTQTPQTTKMPKKNHHRNNGKPPPVGELRQGCWESYNRLSELWIQPKRPFSWYHKNGCAGIGCESEVAAQRPEAVCYSRLEKQSSWWR